MCTEVCVVNTIIYKAEKGCALCVPTTLAMYGTTYVMYVCATAFCGSWKSSYIHEGGGNCLDFLYFGLHIVMATEKTRKRDKEVLGFDRQY